MDWTTDQIMTSEAPHYGAVTHASCALASLHNKSIRVARGLDQPDLDPQYSTASQFYNKAYLLLCPTKTGPTAYTEYDALAALQLVSYWVLFGGAGQWSELLDAARGWIVTTGLPTHENPRLALLELSQVGKLVVKITMVSISGPFHSLSPPILRFFHLVGTRTHRVCIPNIPLNQ